MEWWLIYLLTGAFVGFFAGLLGIGGGLIIVPVLISAFTAQDFPLDGIRYHTGDHFIYLDQQSSHASSTRRCTLGRS